MYKGPLYIPAEGSVFELKADFITNLTTRVYTSDSQLSQYGVQPAGKDRWLIPAGNKFTVTYVRGRLRLEFTKKLNPRPNGVYNIVVSSGYNIEIPYVEQIK